VEHAYDQRGGGLVGTINAAGAVAETINPMKPAMDVVKQTVGAGVELYKGDYKGAGKLAGTAASTVGTGLVGEAAGGAKAAEPGVGPPLEAPTSPISPKAFEVPAPVRGPKISPKAYEVPAPEPAIDPMAPTVRGPQISPKAYEVPAPEPAIDPHAP